MRVALPAARARRVSDTHTRTYAWKQLNIGARTRNLFRGEREQNRTDRALARLSGKIRRKIWTAVFFFLFFLYGVTKRVGRVLQSRVVCVFTLKGWGRH